MKKNVSILGVGLIGGSLGMALRKTRKYRVTGIGRNIARLKRAKRLGAVDSFTTDWAEGAKDADIVVLCPPVNLIASAAKRMARYVKPGAVITDAGSVKGEIVRAVGKKINFVGGHPMAGLEKTGVDFAKAGLYKGATVVLTPSRKSKASRMVKKMWMDAGARVIFMSPAEHDRIAALVSHLPHVLAYNLSLAAARLNRTNPKAAKMLAGSFRDMTRVADSSPSDWAAIFRANKKELSKAVRAFCGGLGAAWGEKAIAAARDARRRLLEAKG